MSKAEVLSKAWTKAGPKGCCPEKKVQDLFLDVPSGEVEGMVQWGELSAWLLDKPVGSRDLAVEVLTLRAETLLAAAKGERSGLDKVWPDGTAPNNASGKEEEWNHSLVAFGGTSPAQTCAANHFLKVVESGLDANRVAFPFTILRKGWPKPVPSLAEPTARVDVNDAPFPTPGLIGGARTTPVAKTADDEEGGRIWLGGLARTVDELRGPVHGDGITLELTLTPWPMHSMKLLDFVDWSQDTPVKEKGKKPRVVAKAWRFDAKRVADDATFIESGQYLRGEVHAEAKALDMILEPWKALEGGVIQSDQCTEAQLALIKTRQAHGPPSAKAVQRRRAILWNKLVKQGNKDAVRPQQVVNPLFFEEIRPALEKESSLAEMKARWARDKAAETRAFDEAAARGATFTAWPTERQLPVVDAAWTRFSKWFRMWRNKEQQAKQAFKVVAPGQVPELKRSASGSSDASSLSSSWEVLSECTNASWQEVDAEADVDAQKAALQQALFSMNCVTKADITELKALAKPPASVGTLAQGLCLIFGMPQENGMQIFQEMDLMSKICKYDKLQAMSAKTINKLTALCADPNFRPNAMKQKSNAAAGLCQWVHALREYRRIAELLTARGIDARAVSAVPAKALAQAEKAAPAADLFAPAAKAVDTGVDVAALRAALQQALDKMCCWTKADMCELKSLKKPAEGIQKVVKGMCLALGVKPSRQWKNGKLEENLYWNVFLEMDSQGLLNRLSNYDKLQVLSVGTTKKLQAMQADGEFQPDALKKCSNAAAGLCMWILGLLEYRRIAAQLAACGIDVRSPTKAAALVQVVPTLKMQEEEEGANLSEEELRQAVAEARNRIAGVEANLKSNWVKELKSFGKPPAACVEVCKAVAYLLGYGRKTVPDWAACQKMMANPQAFLFQMRCFRPHEASEEACAKVRAIAQTCSFDPEVLNKKSCASAEMGTWLTSVLTFRALVKRLPVACLSEEEASLLLKQAQEGLNTIRKADICELKALANPPVMVIKVMAAVQLALGRKDTSWQASKATLHEMTFLDQLIRNEPANLSDTNLRRLEAFLKDPFFNVDIVKKSSGAAAGLCCWVIAVVACATLQRENNPQTPRADNIGERDEKGHAVIVTPGSTAAGSHRLLSPGASTALSTPVMTPSKTTSASLRTPCKADLAELKSFAKPPSGVKMLTEAMATLLNGVDPSVQVDEDGGWKAIKMLLGDPALGQYIGEFGRRLEEGTVPEANLEKVRDMRTKGQETFNRENAAAVSKALVGLCDWVNDAIDFKDE